MNNKEQKQESIDAVAFLAGFVSVGAWFTAADFDGAFDFWRFASSALAMAFFAFLTWGFGYVAVSVGKKEKSTLSKVLCLLGVFAFEAAAIYYIFFR